MMDQNNPLYFEANPKRNKKLIDRLKRKNEKWLENKFQQAHDFAFKQINCLDCANCCKTTGPLFTKADIQRISRHFGMNVFDFIDNYLRMDEDGDYVLQQVPCPFLGTDNYCDIYDNRPKACREYPHSDMKKQKKLLSLHLKNAAICPAMDHILRQLESLV